MARTPIDISYFDRFGATEATPVAANITDGHSIPDNDGRMFMIMANVSNAATVSATIDIPRLFDTDLTIMDIIVSCAPGGKKYIGSFKPSIFNRSVLAATEPEDVYFTVGSTGVTFTGYRMST